MTTKTKTKKKKAKRDRGGGSDDDGGGHERQETVQEHETNSLDVDLDDGLSSADAEFRAMYEKVKWRGWLLSGATRTQRDNYTIVEAAVRSNGKALQYASPRLRSDETLCRIAVHQESRSLEFVECPKVQNDVELIRSLVATDGAVLRYTCEEIRAQKDIVLIALRDWAHALEYASPELKNDIELVTIAIKRNPTTIKYAGEEVRDNNRDVWQMCLPKNGRLLFHAGPSIKQDRELVKMAVKNAGTALGYADRSLQADRRIAKVAVRADGRALPFASVDLRNDPQLVTMALPDIVDKIEDVMGTELSRRLQTVQSAMRKLNDTNDIFLLLKKSKKKNDDGHNTQNVRKFAEQNIARSFWEVMWVLRQVGDDRTAGDGGRFDTNIRRHVIEYSGHTHRIRLANEFCRLAPLIGKLANCGKDLKDMQIRLPTTIPATKSSPTVPATTTTRRNAVTR